MRFPISAILAVLLIVPACNRNEPQSTQAAAEQRTATEQAKNERDAYVKITDARLSEFDQKLDGLDARANAMSGEKKANFKNAIDGLRDQRKAVASKLDDLKSVNIDSWTTLRSDVNTALSDLEQSYTRVSDIYQTPGAPAKPKTY